MKVDGYLRMVLAAAAVGLLSAGILLFTFVNLKMQMAKARTEMAHEEVGWPQEGTRPPSSPTPARTRGSAPIM